MADFATALRTRLVADSTVAGKVDKKVYWGIAPQKAALPYIRLQTISDPRDEHLKGYNGARVTRVQADCFASTYAAARSLAESVVTAVATPTTAGGVKFGRVKAEGPRDLGEDTANGYVHRMSLDLLIEHALA